MIDLTDQSKEAIKATIRNGMGLTVAAKGLQIAVDELSTFIRQNPDFHQQLKESASQGFQYILSNINNAAIKKHWNAWHYTKDNLKQQFIMNFAMWECHTKAEDWSSTAFMTALKIHKTVDETATAMGHTEQEIWDKIYADASLQVYLVELGIAL